MRKLILLTCFLVLNGALGLVISVEPGENTIGLNDNLTIDYEINLDSSEVMDYVIKLINEDNEYILLSTSNKTSPVDESISYNVATIESGTYQLRLELSSEMFPNLTVNSNNNITIIELTAFEVGEIDTIYTMTEEVSAELLIMNNGNTKINFALYFTGAQSEITINPQSFFIEPGEEKNVIILVKKPESNYNTTLNIIGTYGEEETIIKKDVNVIIPIINLNTSNINVSESTNETMINFLISNTGNMDINYSVDIRTFDFKKGFTTITRKGLISANTTDSINYNLDKTQVTSVTIYYSNGTATLEIENKLSVFDYIPLDFELTPNRILLIIIAVLIIGFIAWSKLFRRRRP